MCAKRRDRLDNSSLFDCETGSVRKKWKGKLPVALVFPNTYRLGMSNLGFQLVFSLLNSHPDLVCERVFLNSKPPHSIESNRPLRDFPVILFSISFEHDFVGVVELLRRGGIAPLASERRSGHDTIRAGSPLVIGGGVATFINPEPLAPFMDAFLLGEIEPVVDDFVEYLLEFQRGADCQALMRQMASEVNGCYVPSLYSLSYERGGELAAVTPEAGVPARIKKNIGQGQPLAGHSQILTPETEFADIHLVELGRGCSRSCRFCAAGYVYRPPRLWSAESIVEAIKARPEATRRVGLLGMEMAKTEDLKKITDFLLKDSCSLSFSSLRADMINETLLELLTRSKLKTAVIAPDGSSERLRRVINKGITEDDCLQAAESLVRTGVRNLKLYFMIGLPTEEREDLVEMVALVRKIQDKILVIGRARGRLSNIALSVNCFVPKAWTPFQFHGFTPIRELKARVKFLRKEFAAFHNLKMTVDRPLNAFFQAMLAKGDRRVGLLLSHVAQSTGNWRQVYRDNDLDPEFYAVRLRREDELFPWDIVDHGINRSFLWREYQLALDEKTSKPCEIATDVRCRKCGVCS